MTYCHLLDNRTKIAILSLKAVLILQEKSLEVMKKHSVENSPFWMTLTIYPCH
jgi:phenylacetate-coenzyme A ligase PaaK-like adenylate-forming protein